MSDIALIVEPGSTPSSVAASLDIFRIANRLAGGEACRTHLFSTAGGPVRLGEGIAIDTAALPASLAGFDAVVLPGFFAADAPALFGRLECDWPAVIARLGQAQGLVAASCYGTFVLGESGLLDGHAATTTWWFQREFARRYPRVRLSPERALVDDGKVITAGAMTAHTELSMQVLRRLEGAELAHRVGAIMLVDGAKSLQLPFASVPRAFADPVAQEAADWMAARVTETFSAQELAAACHVSYRTLHRRFAAAAGMAPLEYQQALKVERAKFLLETTRASPGQIGAEIGYGDESSFRRLFVRLAGLSPAQYRRRFWRG